MVVHIPPLAHSFKLADLPISPRLEGVLSHCGYTTLGDADGALCAQLLSIKNCGRKSIKELLKLVARAGAGEFSPIEGLDAAALWQDMALTVDTAMLKFPPRNRLILWGRIHGPGGDPKTLESVGLQFGVSRERIRQIVDDCLMKLRRCAGPRLVENLRAFKRKGNRQTPPPGKRTRLKTLRGGSGPRLYEPLFYDRIFDELIERFPVD